MQKRTRGFSLVEFMIAITIGLFLIAGLVYLIAETSRSRAEIERSSRQIENGRFALDRIAEDLRHAGFYGEYFSVPASGEAGFPASLNAAAPCASTVATLPAGMPLPIQAYDGGSAIPTDLDVAGCALGGAGLVLANYKTGTDILVVRRASTATLPKASAVATDVYIQTTPLAYVLDVGSNAAAFNLTLPSANNTATVDARLRRYVVRIYFVSRCNVPASGATCNGATDDGGTSIPTLKMLELGPGQVFTVQPIAEGIEEVQYDFGIDNRARCGLAADPNEDKNGVADCEVMCTTAAPCSAVDFSNVMTVRVNLIARNAEPSPGYSDDKTYYKGLAGYTTATNDRYRRHAYSALVRLNNVAMRRE